MHTVVNTQHDPVLHLTPGMKWWRWIDSREVETRAQRNTGRMTPPLVTVLALVGIEADTRGVLNADQVSSLGLPDGLHSVTVQEPDAQGDCGIPEGLQELPDETLSLLRGDDDSAEPSPSG